MPKTNLPTRQTLTYLQLVVLVFIMVRTMKLRYRYAVVSGAGTMAGFVVLLLTLNRVHESHGTAAADDAAGDNSNVLWGVGAFFYVILLVRSSWEDEWALQFTFLTKGVKDMKHFCGRFQIQSYEQSCMHTSSRCIVMRAIDTGENDDREDDVVIKFMTNERSFIRELSARETDLDPDLVVPVRMSSASPALQDIWCAEVDLKLEMSGSEFQFGLIMPAASKTLAQVLMLDNTTHQPSRTAPSTASTVSTRPNTPTLRQPRQQTHPHSRSIGDGQRAREHGIAEKDHALARP